MNLPVKSNVKVSVLEVGKWLLFILAAVVIISVFASRRSSNVNFERLSASVVASSDAEDMRQGDTQMIKRLYGLDPADYTDILLYYPATNMGAEEVFLVRMSSMDQLETVRTAIEKRLENQKSSFDGYGDLQMQMLDKAVVVNQGKDVLFAVAEDAENVKKAFFAAL